MDSRTAAHVLSQIAAYLELKGENAFKRRAYDGAARALRALAVEDLEPLYRSGELAGVRGFGPATLAVVRELIETGESRYLEQLRESTPEGLLDMLAVPGMTPARIRRVYEELNIETVEALETAAFPRFPKSAPRRRPGSSPALPRPASAARSASTTTRPSRLGNSCRRCGSTRASSAPSWRARFAGVWKSPARSTSSLPAGPTPSPSHSRSRALPAFAGQTARARRCRS